MKLSETFLAQFESAIALNHRPGTQNSSGGNAFDYPLPCDQLLNSMLRHVEHCVLKAPRPNKPGSHYPDPNLPGTIANGLFCIFSRAMREQSEQVLSDHDRQIFSRNYGVEAQTLAQAKEQMAEQAGQYLETAYGHTGMRTDAQRLIDRVLKAFPA